LIIEIAWINVWNRSTSRMIGKHFIDDASGLSCF